MAEMTAQATVPTADPAVRTIRRGLMISVPTLLFWIWVVASGFTEADPHRNPLTAVNLVFSVIWLGLVIRAWVSPERQADGAAFANLGMALWLFYQTTVVHWLLAVPAVVHVMSAYLLGTGLFEVRKRKAAETKDKPAPAQPETTGVWVKENIEAIIIAFVMALVIRCFCIEVFKIPSSSMEPTLLGDLSDDHRRESCDFSEYHVNPTGDRIMVTKYYYVFNPVERFDIAVFKFPLNQSKNFIKRVVGLPEERLFIDGGNLWVRPKGQDRYRIARKPPRIQESVWINPSDVVSYLGDRKVFEEYWEAGPIVGEDGFADFAVSDSRLKTLERKSAKNVEFSLRPRHLPGDGSGRRAGDLRVSFAFEGVAAQGEVFARIVNEHGTFTLHLNLKDPSGSTLVHEGHVKNNTVPVKGVKIQPDQRVEVDLMVYDGIAIAKVNRTQAAELEYCDYYDAIKETKEEYGIAFGAKETLVTISDVRIGRDICYKGRPERNIGEGPENSKEIPAGNYLMMGDNVQNSHDGRQWKKHVFHLKDGRVIVCEGQEISSRLSEMQAAEQRHGWDHPPEYFIKADEHGIEHLFDTKDIQMPGGIEEPRDFMFVEYRFLVGKAFWVWWPPKRWCRLIR